MSAGILQVIKLIVAFLCAATLVTHTLVRYLSPGYFGEIRLRIRTWWVMLSIFMLAVVLGPMVSIVFFAMLSFLALREYISLVPLRQADRPVLMWMYLTIPVQYWLIAANQYELFAAFIPVAAFVAISTRMVMAGEMSGFITSVSTLNWGLMLTVYLLGHTGFLLIITTSGSQGNPNSGLLVFLVLLTQLNDVAQFISGKLFGRHRETIKASPNKTTEGVAGGVLVTALAAVYLCPMLTGFTAREALIAGLLISVGGFLGDITISAAKRDLHIKDSGTLLPGHGGVLDRVDSLLFTAPLFFHYVYQLQIHQWN